MAKKKPELDEVPPEDVEEESEEDLGGRDLDPGPAPLAAPAAIPLPTTEAVDPDLASQRQEARSEADRKAEEADRVQAENGPGGPLPSDPPRRLAPPATPVPPGMVAPRPGAPVPGSPPPNPQP